ncbi:S8 family serine peptidase [bacterium]|nr:S8 family serine peptidase [bacterium]
MHRMQKRSLLSVVVTILIILAVAILPSESSAGPMLKLIYSQFDGAVDGEPDMLPEYCIQPLDGTGFGYYIVQFESPITEAMKAGLKSRTEGLITYLPDFAFLVKMRPSEASELSRDASLPVYWVGSYRPAYKLSRTLLEFVRSGDFALGNATPTLIVQLFPTDGQLEPLMKLEELVKRSGAGVDVLGCSPRPSKPRLILSVSVADLSQFLPLIASQADVECIDLYNQARLCNDSARWIVQTNIENACKLWDYGIHGEGQIIGVGDTGVDADSCFFYDQSQGLPDSTVNNWQRKIIAHYDRTGEGSWDEDGHGTHVAGTLAGDNYASPEEYDLNDGIAYRAKLVVQDVGDKDNLSSIPYSLSSYFQQSYDAGARIHSNSWGEVLGEGPDTSYNYHSQDVDDYMWKHHDFLTFFACGNDGPAENMVGAPSTAKNCVSVGSCENFHGTLSQNNMADSSSHGPARDGRIKPTIVAPGQYLDSAESDHNISSYNCGTTAKSGTSMACPVAAASATLTRQYFMDGFYPTGMSDPADGFEPSASLLKAVLINGAVDMTGSRTGGSIPAHGQGWGRLNLDEVLFFNGDDRRLSVWDVNPGLQTGRSDEYPITIETSDLLKVTLVWTDYPSSSAVENNLVNDLDLTVTAPSGTTYRGNNFNFGLSQAGGQPDHTNVVECVYIRNPEFGEHTIKVQGYGIPNGPQPYSLVIVGAEEAGTKPPELSNGDVSPFTGSLSTTFTYTVDYFDPDESAPTVMNVVIDDVPHAMRLDSGGTPADGSYTYETSLGVGVHTYYFYCEDADGLSDRMPYADSYPGPNVGGANVAPILSEGEVWPPSGNPSASFAWTIHYFDLNGDNPETIQVVIDGSVMPMTLSQGVPYNGYYGFQTDQLTVGVHSYYFQCNDGGGGADRLPDTGTISGPSVVEGNVAPTLQSGEVSPESGSTNTTFEYSVRYYDADGDEPSLGVVYIDDEPYAMWLQSGTADDGTYLFTTQLGLGSHSFYFKFEDTSANSTVAPESGAYSGPEVEAGNTPPVLMNGQVSPESGDPNTTFVYSVHYFDADGDEPVTSIVYVDNIEHEMTLADGDYANGTYQYATLLPQADEHWFLFSFYDGESLVRDPTSGIKEGPSVFGTEPDIEVTLSLNGESYFEDDRHILWFGCNNKGLGAFADLYLVLQMPDGSILYYPTLLETPAPLSQSFSLYSGYSLVGYEMINVPMPGLGTGIYTWYSAFTTPGTMDTISNIAAASWHYAEAATP